MPEEQNNPFAEFGGEVVKKETNPFAEFGGELKKKTKIHVQDIRLHHYHLAINLI